MILGPADCAAYQTCFNAWGSTGMSDASLDPQFTYTEFVELQFPSKVYPKQLVEYEVCLPIVSLLGDNTLSKGGGCD